MTVLSPEATHAARQAASPDLWYQDAIFYEVPVKSFYDSNADGLGDFRGLTQKLDYLQELGITCLWLLPFSPSPWRDDGYDVADYRGIHPAYGSMADFQALVEEAHRRGLRVVAEMVVNHTSDQHPWFLAARTAPTGSPLRDFYVWSDTDQRFREARGNGCGWSWDAAARAFYWHRFHSFQPDLNYDNPLVRQEMARVLRFWLERGVDGLSLTGAPYLVEREGTHCEDLPETHAILRELRRAALADHGDRLLAAGVNLWPTEARSYFGDGNECQMTFDFPLAQRLFLAVRQEDRHAITDILRQTPAAPTSCQWIGLLRNHDELTLGLATDEERDYLYREYAADPRMRHALGIRRRLAPLLENSRRRLELLLGLLFSLPRAPLLYYGDEIGMGDNIYLGDRNSIRTPMQWNSDRNAGFSQADFAALYCPPVMDPVYGYQTVNVEAQRRDPSSLLHWVRQRIALRKRLRSLTRGSLELLEPSNRKVLAFLRRDGDEVLLCVANLARSVQPVELDLSVCAGLVPVEVSGRTPFPRIGAAPYFLTLGPHAFYWFLLQKEPADVAARLAPVPTEEIEVVPSVSVNGGPESVLDGPARQALERDVLPAFLRSQRWFGGKARRVESVRFAHWAPLPTQTAASFLAFLTVRFEGGAEDLYFLPLAVTTGAAAAALAEAMRPRLIARLQGSGWEGFLHDALASDEVCTTLLEAIGKGQEFALDEGRVVAQPTSAFAVLRGRDDGPLPIVRGAATSSNSLVLFGRRLLLKLFRRLEAGINPDIEIGKFLTEQHPFERIPRVAGSLEYRRPEADPISLGILQALVPNQGDGWEHAINELGRYFERASGRMYGPDPAKPDARSVMELSSAVPPPGALEVIGSYLHAAAMLGRRTAEMHQALADDPRDPAFAPEPLTNADVAALTDEVTGQASRALQAVRDNLDRLPQEVAPGARQLLDEGPDVLARLKLGPDVPPGPWKIRCHGDYHLGQVLWVDNDFIILDFEGEPTRSVAERRAKQSPLKDVAGMLRSFDYAAYAGLFAFTQDRPDDFARLEPWAALWQQWISAAFLHAYRETAGGARFLPAEPTRFAALLDFYLLDKAFYELVYELNNRPDWVRIPLRGIFGLVQSE